MRSPWTLTTEGQTENCATVPMDQQAARRNARNKTVGPSVGPVSVVTIGCLSVPCTASNPISRNRLAPVGTSLHVSASWVGADDGKQILDPLQCGISIGFVRGNGRFGR